MGSPTETLSALGDNFGAAGGFVGGLAKGALDRTQASAYEAAGRVASAAANTREEAYRREGRQATGEAVAEIAQSGAGFTDTTKDLISQSETNASLDALNARYQGLMERTNDDNQAQSLRRQAKAEPFIGAITGATKALAFMRGYGAG